MKHTITIAIACLSSVAFAGNPLVFTDYATVVDSQPVYHTSSPREDCTERYETQQPQVKQNNVAGKLVGGLLGAAIGSKVGKGSGRTVASVAGGLAGYELGKEYLSNDNSSPERIKVRTCREIPGETRIVGYALTAKFHGKIMNMEYPTQISVGQTIPVTVTVSASGGPSVDNRYESRDWNRTERPQHDNNQLSW